MQKMLEVGLKSCLMRYIAKSLIMDQFLGHSAEWESRCVYDIFTSIGYHVTMLNWKGGVHIDRTYDVVFDVGNLAELAAAFRPDTIKILHLTGSDNVKRNQRAIKRMEEANARRGGLRSTRIIPNPEQAYKSIELADYVTLDGNLETLHTYPEKYWDKIHPVNVTANWIGWME